MRRNKAVQIIDALVHWWEPISEPEPIVRWLDAQMRVQQAFDRMWLMALGIPDELILGPESSGIATAEAQEDAYARRLVERMYPAWRAARGP